MGGRTRCRSIAPMPDFVDQHPWATDICRARQPHTIIRFQRQPSSLDFDSMPIRPHTSPETKTDSTKNQIAPRRIIPWPKHTMSHFFKTGFRNSDDFGLRSRHPENLSAEMCYVYRSTCSNQFCFGRKLPRTSMAARVIGQVPWYTQSTYPTKKHTLKTWS